MLVALSPCMWTAPPRRHRHLTPKQLDTNSKALDHKQSMETAAHRAAANSDLPALLTALDKHPSEAFARDEEGRMPQHLAAKGGHTACLQALLDAGADLEAADRYGLTAVHLAAGSGVGAGFSGS